MSTDDDLDRIEAKLDLLVELVTSAFGLFDLEEYDPGRPIVDVPDIATYEAKH